MSSKTGDAYMVGIIFVSTAVSVAAMATHIWMCYKRAQWIFMMVGLVVTPIGILHGVAAWFGYGVDISKITH